MTMLRAAFFVLLTATVMTGSDQTPRTYQHGTILGWSNRYYPSGFSGKHMFFELKGDGMVYQIDDCGSFQAGQFTAGEVVDFRVDESEKRIYIRRDQGKEYKCKMDGAKAVASPKADSSSATSPAAKP